MLGEARGESPLLILQSAWQGRLQLLTLPQRSAASFCYADCTSFKTSLNKLFQASSLMSLAHAIFIVFVFLLESQQKSGLRTEIWVMLKGVFPQPAAWDAYREGGV